MIITFFTGSEGTKQVSGSFDADITAKENGEKVDVEITVPASLRNFLHAVAHGGASYHPAIAEQRSGAPLASMKLSIPVADLPRSVSSVNISGESNATMSLEEKVEIKLLELTKGNKLGDQSYEKFEPKHKAGLQKPHYVTKGYASKLSRNSSDRATVNTVY